jgi:hypothetical protein
MSATPGGNLAPAALVDAAGVFPMAKTRTRKAKRRAKSRLAELVQEDEDTGGAAAFVRRVPRKAQTPRKVRAPRPPRKTASRTKAAGK